MCRPGRSPIILVLTHEQKSGSHDMGQERPGAIPLTPRQEPSGSGPASPLDNVLQTGTMSA